MQKRIQKETGNNCLKRIIVAFLAVIMMTTNAASADGTGCNKAQRMEFLLNRRTMKHPYLKQGKRRKTGTL